jgi:hypothetical protein
MSTTTASDPEYWTNNSRPFQDCAGNQWTLRDASLSNSDHIAFRVYLGALANRVGLFVNIQATTVSYDSEGVRHVQTEDDWVASDSEPLDEESFGSGTLSYSSQSLSPHVNYDLLARQVLSSVEADRYDGGSTFNRQLCERAMTLANAINQRSESYEPSCEVTDNYAVLDCIYVARTVPSLRRTWRNVGYPSPDAPLSQHRMTRYGHQDLDGRHVMTLRRCGTPRDYAEEDQARGESLTIDEADLESRAVSVLRDELRVLDMATREVKAEAERDGRSLSVYVYVKPLGSLFSAGDQVAETSEGEEIVD